MRTIALNIEKIAGLHLKWKKHLLGAGVDATRMGVRVDCNIVSDFFQQGRARKFSVECDEPKEIGGTNRAPRPVEYLLLGLAFCQASICLEMAAVLGIRVTKVRVAAHAEMDLRGIYGTAEVSPGFRNVTLNLALGTEESGQEQRVGELVRLLQQRCPAYATFVHSTPVLTRVELNGRTLESAHERS